MCDHMCEGEGCDQYVSGHAYGGLHAETQAARTQEKGRARMICDIYDVLATLYMRPACCAMFRHCGGLLAAAHRHRASAPMRYRPLHRPSRIHAESRRWGLLFSGIYQELAEYQEPIRLLRTRNYFLDFILAPGPAVHTVVAVIVD